MSINCNDYVRFREVKAYLSECLSNTAKTHNDIKNICEKSGYKKQDKFIRHLHNWMNLKTDVPLDFLRAIGAANEVIFEKLEADKNEFEKYKNSSLHGAYGVIRFFSAMYNAIGIPKNYSEKECINYVASQLTRNFLFVIHFGEVKSIYVDKLRNEETIFCDPDLKVGKASLLIKGTQPEVHYKDHRMFDIAKLLNPNNTTF
jgi:hypothetical protein